MNNNIIIILNFLILLITILLTVFLITNYKETFSESNRRLDKLKKKHSRYARRKLYTRLRRRTRPFQRYD